LGILIIVNFEKTVIASAFQNTEDEDAELEDLDGCERRRLALTRQQTAQENT
jgi:hypothetical protein